MKKRCDYYEESELPPVDYNLISEAIENAYPVTADPILAAYKSGIDDTKLGEAVREQIEAYRQCAAAIAEQEKLL